MQGYRIARLIGSLYQADITSAPEVQRVIKFGNRSQ
jgi:hypothetical protein